MLWTDTILNLINMQFIYLNITLWPVLTFELLQT